MPRHYEFSESSEKYIVVDNQRLQGEIDDLADVISFQQGKIGALENQMEEVNQAITSIQNEIEELWGYNDRLRPWPIGFYMYMGVNHGETFVLDRCVFTLQNRIGFPNAEGIILYGGAASTEVPQQVGSRQITLQIANIPPHTHDYYVWSSKNDPATGDLAFEKGNTISTQYWMTTNSTGGYNGTQTLPIMIPTPIGWRTYLYQCTSHQ